MFESNKKHNEYDEYCPLILLDIWSERTYFVVIRTISLSVDNLCSFICLYMRMSLLYLIFCQNDYLLSAWRAASAKEAAMLLFCHVCLSIPNLWISLVRSHKARHYKNKVGRHWEMDFTWQYSQLFNIFWISENNVWLSLLVGPWTK